MSEFEHIVWCDLEIVVLKIHSYSSWDTKMVSSGGEPDLSKPVVNVYICRDDDVVFDDPRTYRENIVRHGSYRGHIFGVPARFKIIDDKNIALSHPDPGKIIWALVVKYVLTVYAIQQRVLHLKGAAVAYQGRAFLLLGRGGSGKTEVAKVLCENGAELMANTHLLVGGGSVCGIKSNIRVRENGRDVYLPVGRQQNFTSGDGWLPVGGVFWLKYRTDGQAAIRSMPPSYAKANLQYFAESIKNWEIKEDIADYVRSDPFEFAELVNRVDQMLDDFCADNEVHHVNVDIFAAQGLAAVMSLMEARPQ